METGQIYDKQLNKPLDEVLLLLNEIAQDNLHNKQIKTYNSFSDLGLDAATATLEDIIHALPSYSLAQFDVYVGGSPNLDIPASGMLQVVRAGSTPSKAYITFKNENISLYRVYNRYVTPNLHPWYALGWASQSIKASTVNNQLSNIRTWGMHFYFSVAEAESLTDKPEDLGSRGFSIVSYGFGNASDQFYQVLTENHKASRQWHRAISGSSIGVWRTIPQVLTAKELEARQKRVGDSYIDEENILHIITTKGAMKVDYERNLNAGWRKMPDGVIQQWGYATMDAGASSVTVNFPIAFNKCFFAIPFDVSSLGNALPLSCVETTSTTATFASNGHAGAVRYFAMGS